jgi:transposase
MSTQEARPKRPYFRPTTPQQRRLLFEIYEATGSVSSACRKAHVGRRTFYYWLPRFREGGYAALEVERSRAPHTTRIPPTPPPIVQEVIAYKNNYPEAGYRSIADEVRKAHNWEPVVGPTKVREILIEAGLVTPRAQSQPESKHPTVAHAPEPGQTVNVDLCVVPVTHSAAEPLVSVSLAAAANGTFSPCGDGD